MGWPAPSTGAPGSPSLQCGMHLSLTGTQPIFESLSQARNCETSAALVGSKGNSFAAIAVAVVVSLPPQPASSARVKASPSRRRMLPLLMRNTGKNGQMDGAKPPLRRAADCRRLRRRVSRREGDVPVVAVMVIRVIVIMIVVI